MSWKDFNENPSLSCRLCNSKTHIEVQQIPARRAGGHYKVEVVAVCLSPSHTPNYYRIKLGGFRQGEAKYVMQKAK